MERLLGIPSTDDCNYLDGELNDNEKRAATLSGIALLTALVSLCVVLAVAISARDENAQRLAVKIAGRELSRQRRHTDFVQKEAYEGVMKSTLHLCKSHSIFNNISKHDFDPIPVGKRTYGTSVMVKNPVFTKKETESKKLMKAECVVPSQHLSRTLIQRLNHDHNDGVFLCTGRRLTEMTEPRHLFNNDPKADLRVGVKFKVCPLTDVNGHLTY